MLLRKIIYNINGVDRLIDVDIDKETLADVLRRIGMPSVKIGCGTGQCGACTVLLDGKPVRACMKKIKNIPENSLIETVEGIGIADYLHPLQLAWIKYGGVQCGFCTPGFIMSAKGLLEVNPSPTREEVRKWFTKNNNLCRCTGYKPLVDAVMAAAEVMRGEKSRESLVYQIPEDGKVYGTELPRPAAKAKVMGACYYGNDLADLMPDGTLRLALTFSEQAHANILSIDTSEAEAMPGVAAVLTHKDVKGTNDIGCAINHKHSQVNIFHTPILCDKKVDRLGATIAIVAADTEEHARAAAKMVKVEYEPLPTYKNYLEACMPGAVRIHPDFDNVYCYQPVFKGRDTAEIWEEAEADDSKLTVLEGSFASSREPHLALEPNSLQAFYDEDGMLTIQYKSQSIYSQKSMIWKGLGIDADKVRIIESPTGASFGFAMAWDMPAIIGVAAIALEKPVTLTLNYAENQKQTGKRASSYHNMKMACDENGKIVALDYDSAADLGSSITMGLPLLTKLSRYAGYWYNVPNLRGIGRLGVSNQPPCVAYRAFGSPQTYTAIEPMIDMMAEKLGIDPFEFRYINTARPGDLSMNSYPHRLYPHIEMMDRMRPHYEEALKWKNEPTDPGWKRGIGVCCGGYHVSGPVDKAIVALELNPDGSVTNFNTWEDQGQGGDIGTLVHTYEALKPLGLPLEKIKMYQNDSKYCPATGAASSSRCHFMAGSATLDAARQLMDAMRKEDGTYRTYDEMIAEGIPTKYEGIYSNVGKFHALHEDTGVGDPYVDQNFVVYLTKIEVEEATGKVKLVSVYAIANIGVIGNKLALEGQALGGLAHSLGFAIKEDYSDLEKKYQTPIGCGFLRCEEIPDDIVFEYMETPRENGPHGSGGASECFQCVGHTSVMNAIFNAVGVRINEIPALPEKVKAAMEAKAEGKEYMPSKYYLGEDFEDVVADIKANMEEVERELSAAEIAELIERGGH